jgi:hypothetical protein
MPFYPDHPSGPAPPTTTHPTIKPIQVTPPVQQYIHQVHSIIILGAPIVTNHPFMHHAQTTPSF